MVSKAKKSTMFHWVGTDRRGNRIKGEMPGQSVALVKSDLRRKGISPLKVKKKTLSQFSLSRPKITAKDIAILSRQLSTMMSAGVPLVQSFDIVAKGTDNLAMQQMITSIKTDVEGGGTLAQAMAKHPRQFDNLYCSLIAAGEQAGILETLLDKIAAYKEKTEAIKGKIKKALFYPVAIIIVAFAITALLLLFVVPQFQTLFESFGGDLPAPTKVVIALSAFLQGPGGLALLGAIGIAGFMLYKAKQTSAKFNASLDRLVLQLPLFGILVKKATIARFARTLATMFTAGVPLVEAMASVAGAAGNRVYTDAILAMRDDIATGQQLQTAMAQTNLFPNMVTQMVAIGEESGALDTMLSKVADFYEREVDETVDGLSSLMEPIIMVVLGLLIGGLVISMYLPIFKMGQIV